MDLFLNFMAGKLLQADPELLDIVRNDQSYQVFEGNSPLLTPGGREFIHPSERVARLIITDLMYRNGNAEPDLSAPWLYVYQKDLFEPSGDPFAGAWTGLLANDPFVMLKTSGRNDVRAFSPEDQLFGFAFLTLSELIRRINVFINSRMGEILSEDADQHPFLQILRMCYDQFSNEQKVAVQVLSDVHQSHLTLPVLHVAGIISPLEYAKGLIALKIGAEESLPGVLPGLVRVKDYLECLDQVADEGSQAAALIREGENDLIEFKSTLRWDIRAGKTNQAVERASLKTIAAFLNSAGGTLLIGVADDGSIEGIERDKFVNEDKFLLHLWTLIRACLGRDVSPCIRTTLEKTDEKTICLVRCRRSNRPVFLRQPGFDEDFYIRIGPSSNAMDISEALKYIADHFPGR